MPVNDGASEWTIQVRRDDFVGGQLVRKTAEYLRPKNQSLELVVSATNFGDFVEGTYRPILSQDRPSERPLDVMD